MKKTIMSFCITLCTIAAANALSWWEQPTICRISPTDCYVGMDAGIDRELWDTSGNCWGMKMICPDATVAGGRNPVPMERAAIAGGHGIKPDFDTNVLNGDCYGARKTTANGSMASVGGKFVRVWCPGILGAPDEVLPNGEIIINGRQPTCAKLAADGYAAVQNDVCWGKHYDVSKYYIDCGNADADIPARLIVLNGADYTTGTTNAPTDRTAADKLFDEMYSVSSTQHGKYFK